MPQTDKADGPVTETCKWDWSDAFHVAPECHPCIRVYPDTISRLFHKWCQYCGKPLERKWEDEA